MKFHLLCQGLTADEIEKLVEGFDRSQLGAVVAEDVSLPREFQDRFAFELHESIEKLLEQVKPALIYIFGVSARQFELVSSLLESGISVNLGSPLILSSKQVESLSSLADRSKARFRIIFSELFEGASSQLPVWADRLDNPEIERIRISISLYNQIPRFRSYIAPNRLHWCYELPCGVFHQELEKSLNLIQPLMGDVINIAVRESGNGYLPQSISDELLVEIEGSRLNAIIEVVIGERETCSEVWYSSNGDEIKIRQIGDEGRISDPGNKKTYSLGRLLYLAKNLCRNLRLPLKSPSHSTTPGESTSIRDKDPDAPANVADMERYSFAHGALEEIARQLSNIHLRFDNRLHTGKSLKNRKRVLITGASGLFGKRLSRYLNDKGYTVRAFIRKLSDCSYFQTLGVEYFYGDVADIASIEQALEGVIFVVHAAADTSGELSSGEVSTVQGTRNILELCSRLEIDRLVYISSCSVYDVVHVKLNAEIDESSLLEQFPERRGAYTLTKLKADLLVQEAISRGRNNVTCLRPGTYISENGPYITPIVGVKLIADCFVIFGLGNLNLPLVYVENLCSAIEISMINSKAKGETFNVIDGLSMSKKEYLEKVPRKIYPNARFIFFPYKLLYFLIFVQEVLLNFLGRKPYLTRYRFESSQKEIRYKSDKIEKLLDWSPPIGADKAIERILCEQQGSSAGEFRT